MFEELLEDIAQKNGLREVNTYLKLTAGLGAILLCLLSTSYLPPLFIAVVLTRCNPFPCPGGCKDLCRTFHSPALVCRHECCRYHSHHRGDRIYSGNGISCPDFSLSVTRESINQGMFVFCRVIGGMSALCFISLTTPMTDIFIAFRQCRVPEVVIDLMMIIYRTIFILMDQVIQIYHAQVMRLGYSTYRESIHSFATLCGAAFIASWDAGDDLIRAMDARCYDGKFALLGENRPWNACLVLAVVVFLVLSAAVVIISGNHYPYLGEP